MKTKRLISLLLAAVFARVQRPPAGIAAGGQRTLDLTTAGVDEN